MRTSSGQFLFVPSSKLAKTFLFFAAAVAVMSVVRQLYKDSVFSLTVGAVETALSEDLSEDSFEDVERELSRDRDDFLPIFEAARYIEDTWEDRYFDPLHAAELTLAALGHDIVVEEPIDRVIEEAPEDRSEVKEILEKDDSELQEVLDSLEAFGRGSDVIRSFRDFVVQNGYDESKVSDLSGWYDDTKHFVAKLYADYAMIPEIWEEDNPIAIDTIAGPMPGNPDRINTQLPDSPSCFADFLYGILQDEYESRLAQLDDVEDEAAETMESNSESVENPGIDWNRVSYEPSSKAERNLLDELAKLESPTTEEVMVAFYWASYEVNGESDDGIRNITDPKRRGRIKDVKIAFEDYIEAERDDSWGDHAELTVMLSFARYLGGDFEDGRYVSS